MSRLLEQWLEQAAELDDDDHPACDDADHDAPVALTHPLEDEPCAST